MKTRVLVVPPMGAAKGGCVGGPAGCCSPQDCRCCLLPPEEDQDLVLKHAVETNCRREHLALGFSAKIRGESQGSSKGLALSGFRLRFLIQLLGRRKDLYSSSVVLFPLPLVPGTCSPFFRDLFLKCVCSLSPALVSYTDCAAETSSPALSFPSLCWSSSPWGRCLLCLECHPAQHHQIISNGKQHNDHSLDVTYHEMGRRQGLCESAALAVESALSIH